MTWTKILDDMNACLEAIEWAETQPSLKQAWRRCKRGDWLLWFIAQTVGGKPNSKERKKLVLAAVECVELALRFTEDKRVRDCVALTRKWAEGGRVSRKALKDAAYAAAGAAAYAADAAYAAADAAYAAAYADRQKMLAKMATIVRRHYPTAPEVSK